jgi:hypothetical protein
MMILAYSGESIVTTDRMGNAVVEYAKALVAGNQTDVIDVPVALESGQAVARLLIGPTSQLIALPVGATNLAISDRTVIEDDSALAEIEQRMHAMGPHSLRMSAESPWDQFALVYDFL